MDTRYTINLEYCGRPEARHVVRFCGHWIGQSETAPGAEAIALAHAVERDKILTGGETSKAREAATLYRAFPLPAAAPDCPCTLDIFTSEHVRVWVSAGPPESEAEWTARRAAEGENYFPRFSIQIEIERREYYDCWDASEYWSDVLAWVPDGHSIGEKAAREEAGDDSGRTARTLDT